MRAGKPAILSVVLVAILAAGCQSIQEVLNLQKPGAKITGLKFADVKLDSAILLFDVQVENPYPVALPLLNMDYGLSSGANRFLSGSADLQATVPAKSTKAVSLPAGINYLEVLKALGGIRPGSEIPYQAELGLAVDTPGLGRITLPLKKDGRIVLPTISDIDVKDIWNMIKPN